MARARTVRAHLALDIQPERARVRDNKLHRGNRRGSGFLFGQLGDLKASTRALYDTGWRKRQAEARAAGECGKYAGRGRFAGKAGGRQVGEALWFTHHNERIVAAYGAYNLWAWLRYWYIDTRDAVTLQLLDKGYYDYDYEPSKDKPKAVKHEQSLERTQRMFDRFGFGKAKPLTDEPPAPMSAEELQAAAMADIAERERQEIHTRQEKA